jgi:hypothetical protein
MQVESVTKAVCNLAMQFGEGEDAEEGALVYPSPCLSLSTRSHRSPLLDLQSRPFGVALLVGGVDKRGPKSTPYL